MLANYHTHTPRCHHATGSEREYVEKAIQEGLQVLGFSDHSPYLFDGDYYSNYRMRPEETPEYVQTIRDLAQEYASQIRLLVGVELEFYPKIFDRTVRFLGEMDCDYLILGQHFVGLEEMDSFHRTEDAGMLDRYVSQTIDAMETGLFTYLCHPDLCNYVGSDSIREKAYLKLCEAAKRMNIPLEINLLGLNEGRNYPSEFFFRIAASVGNEIVFGCDAHQVHRLGDKNELKNALSFAQRCGVTPIELSPERVLSKKHLIR